MHQYKYLFPQLQQQSFVTLNLLLQLKQSKKQSLSRRRTSRHINIHRHNTITPPHNRIRVMVISTPIRTTPHRNNPPRLRHLIINLPQSRCHLIRQSPSHNHNITLTWRCTKDHTKSFHIVS